MRGMKQMLDISADRAATAEVVVADPAKLQRVLSAVTLAFAADPPSRWLFPQADAYLQHFPTFIRGLGGPAVEQGTAFVTPDYAAVSLWLAPGAASDEAAAGAAGRGAHRAREASRRGRRDRGDGPLPSAGAALVSAVHRRSACLAGPGPRRGAAAVMRSRCATRPVCPAYLESTSPRSQPLYERHGFEAIGEIRVGQCPPIVPMLRRARG